MSIEIRYVKRIIMTLDLVHTHAEEPEIKEDFCWIPWHADLIKTHAQLVHAAFRNDLDGRIFPTFRQYVACENLVSATASARSFVPEATWLIGRRLDTESDSKEDAIEYCAAIQCVKKKRGEGEIQNVSVLPDMRRQGLGRALVLKALEAFRNLGAQSVALEATAENAVAIRMYSSLGFLPTKYFYTESFVERGGLW